LQEKAPARANIGVTPEEFQGEPGEQGPKGERGTTGEQGPKGNQGTEGPPGADANTSDNCLTDALTRLSSVFIVARIGELVKQVVKKFFPEWFKPDGSVNTGPAGPEGPQGPKGDNGEKGDSGTSAENLEEWWAQNKARLLAGCVRYDLSQLEEISAEQAAVARANIRVQLAGGSNQRRIQIDNFHNLTYNRWVSVKQSIRHENHYHQQVRRGPIGMLPPPPTDP
jgi:hypothetical protein